MKKIKNISNKVFATMIAATATFSLSVIPVMAVEGNTNATTQNVSEDVLASDATNVDTSTDVDVPTGTLTDVTYLEPSVELAKTTSGYTLDISNIPIQTGVFYETELGKNHLLLAKPIDLDERVEKKIASEGLNCIETFIQDDKSRRAELIIYDPAELEGKPLHLRIIGQNIQLDDDSRVLQVSYINTSDMYYGKYLTDIVKTTDYLFVNGEPEQKEELWSLPNRFFLSDELADHVVELISSYRAFATTRAEVYEGTEAYFDEKGLAFDFDQYFEDYAKEQNISEIVETFVMTDVDDNGEITRTRRVFLAKDKIFVLSTTGNVCSLYSLPRGGKVVTEGNIDEWFDLPEEREIIYPEHHLFYDNSQGTFLYSVIDKNSRLITNWDTFVALRRAIGK